MSSPTKLTERLFAAFVAGSTDLRAAHVPGTPPHWRLIGFTRPDGTEWLGVHDREERTAVTMPRAELPALLRWMRASKEAKAAA